MHSFMRHPFIIVLIACLVVCISCNDNKAYDHYEHTPIAGWDKVDELSFNVPALKDSGRYATNIGLRITNAFPYQSLTLIVEQTIVSTQHNASGNHKTSLIHKTYADTLTCTLFDNKGTIKGRGINIYQYLYRVSERNLHEGDSLHITVRHNMRREIMPGIADVGISISRNGK